MIKQTALFFVLSLCFYVSSLHSVAQGLNGIRIESDAPVEVFVDGNRVCNPVESCMIANLHRGNFLIEVFSILPDAFHSHPKLVYRENVYFQGHGMKEIFVTSSIEQGDTYVNDLPLGMDNETFSRFYKQLKESPFDSDKRAIIDAAVARSWFYTVQVEKIVKDFTFDSEKLPLLKKMYPVIVDKDRAFLLLELLDFSNSKQEFSQFMNQYIE